MQIAILWDAVLDSGNNIKNILFGANCKRKLSKLLPELQIKELGSV